MNQDGFNNMNNNPQDNNGISVGNSGVRPTQPQPINNEYGKEKYILCPKCGQKMKLTARCCMHCGELNYLNHKNDSVKPSFNLGKKLKIKEDAREAKIAAKKAKKAKYVNGVDVTSEEKAKRYRFFKRVTDLLVLILIVVAAINYKLIIKTFDEGRAKYYLKQVDKIVEQVNEEITGDECVNGGTIVYGFMYSDDYFKTGVSLYTLDYFTGYIKVTPTPEGNKYTINITDGKYGLKNVAYEDMDIKSLKKITEIESSYVGIGCSNYE